MTDLDLKELDRLEKAVTQGEWQEKVHCLPRLLSAPCRSSQVEPVIDGPMRTKDAVFIAAARNQLRSLLDLVERMGKALRTARCSCYADGGKGRCLACATLLDYRRAKGA